MPERGLEPPRIAPLVPKTSASTNFATPAYTIIILSNYLILGTIGETPLALPPVPLRSTSAVFSSGKIG